MAWPRRMSVAALLEAAIVVESRGGTAAGHELDLFLETASIELIPVTTEQADAARPRLAALRKRQSSSRVELWRLLCLCACGNKR